MLETILFDVASGALLSECGPEDPNCPSAKAFWSPDRAYKVQSAEDGSISVYETQRGRLLHTLKAHNFPNSLVRFGEEDQSLLIGFHTTTIESLLAKQKPIIMRSSFLQDQVFSNNLDLENALATALAEEAASTKAHFIYTNATNLPSAYKANFIYTRDGTGIQIKTANLLQGEKLIGPINVGSATDQDQLISSIKRKMKAMIKAHHP